MFQVQKTIAPHGGKINVSRLKKRKKKQDRKKISDPAAFLNE